jgi:prephenate dehydrogenase
MMSENRKVNISIIGLGLIGGSIAKALKKSSVEVYINAFDIPETLCQAENERVIDNKLKNIEEAVKSDIIFLCLPVDLSLNYFKRLIPILEEGSILTDVCGVKGIFQRTWDSLSSKGIYIGGHPMTGKEKGGYSNSDPLLFENAVYIISEKVKNESAKAKLLSIVKLLGARAVSLNPFVHDKVVANVSHLPQLLSVALVNNASKNSQEKNNLDFAAGGFRDMTRIASSSFNIWDPVLRYNKDEILSAIESLQGEISKMKDQLITGQIDPISKCFDSARISRDSIPKDTKGFISPLFYISVYVKDEPGIISRISTALFQESINIKDIELLKIREGAGGTFRLAFDGLEDSQRAKVILNDIGFEVY